MNRLMHLLAQLAPVLLLLAVAAPVRAEPVVLGLLEQLSPAQQRHIADVYGVKAESVVRVAFRCEGGIWTALPSKMTSVEQLAAAVRDFPSPFAGTVVLNGRAHGHIESRSPSQWRSYADVGFQ